MSTSKMCRIYYLAAELKPDIPNKKLLSLLGNGWSQLITAGSLYGLAGTSAAVPDCSFDQLVNFYEQGASSGATPNMEEFRATLASVIYEKLCGNDLPVLDKVKLSGQLDKWFSGKDSANGSGVVDFDSEAEFPMFTHTGFAPLDSIAGENGVPQELISILGKPEVGKTSIALAIAHQWRRNNIGPVSFIQTELSHSAMKLKIQGQALPGEKLWRSGEDRLIFGNRAASEELERCEENPDGNRLIIWDSTTGTCGTGDSPEGRLRYVSLYENLMRVKNSSRMVIACGHVKRGQDETNIESAAGSAIIERLSGLIVCIDKEEGSRPDGTYDIRIQTVKNRYAGRVRPFTFAFDYVTGQAMDADW